MKGAAMTWWQWLKELFSTGIPIDFGVTSYFEERCRLHREKTEEEKARRLEAEETTARLREREIELAKKQRTELEKTHAIAEAIARKHGASSARQSREAERISRAWQMPTGAYAYYHEVESDAFASPGSNFITINGDRQQVAGNKVRITTKMVGKNSIRQVIINGKVISSVEGDELTIKWEGDLAELTVEAGDIECGDVKGNVRSSAGNVKCGKVSGDVKTSAGNITVSR
jgi:hypothetical protein